MIFVVIPWAMIWAMLGAACPAGEADLDVPITATWSGIGLREWAGRITETAGQPVLIDRRLDPDTAIRLECRGEPLRDVLDRVATIADGEVVILRSSVRIVPRGMATVVHAAEQARVSRVASLSPRQRALLDKPMPWRWPAGARPRDLVTDAARKADITIKGLAAVPHDHLPRASLSEMTLAEGLDMLLAPFDLRIDWHAATAAGGKTSRAASGRIIPIDTGLPTATTAGDVPSAAKPASGKPLRRPSPPGPKPATEKTTFSLQVAAPLDELLATIATRLELTLDLDRESLTRSGIAPREIVRTTVKDASRDDLLDAILDPLALDWKIDGKTLRVFAR